MPERTDSSQSDGHQGAIGSSFTTGTYHALCTCGWSGEDRATMQEAAADSTAHLDQVRAGVGDGA